MTAVEVEPVSRTPLRPPPLTPMLKAVADESSNGPEVGMVSAPTATLRLNADKEALTQTASRQPNEREAAAVSGVAVVAVFAAVPIGVVVGPRPRPPPLTPMLKAVADGSSNGPEVGRASAPTVALRPNADREALTQMAS